MEKHILICGERGVGKSTLIRRLLAESTLPVGGFVTRRLPQADADGYRWHRHGRRRRGRGREGRPRVTPLGRPACLPLQREAFLIERSLFCIYTGKVTKQLV